MEELHRRVAAFCIRAGRVLAPAAADYVSVASTAPAAFDVDASTASVHSWCDASLPVSTILRPASGYSGYSRTAAGVIEISDDPRCALAGLLNGSTRYPVTVAGCRWPSVDHWLLSESLAAAGLPGPAQSLLGVATVAVAHLVATQALTRARGLAAAEAGRLPGGADGTGPLKREPPAQVDSRSGWTEPAARLRMLTVVRAKLQQHPDLAAALAMTAGRQLRWVETQRHSSEAVAANGQLMRLLTAIRDGRL
jgi:hypothetical protein